MNRFEAFADVLNQLKREAEIALLQLYPNTETCAEIVTRVIEKIKTACAEENEVAVFLACGQFMVSVTRERIYKGIEAEQGENIGGN